MRAAELRNLFDHHPPVTAARIVAHQRVRAGCHDLATELDLVVPEGREKDNAIDALRMVMFWSNAAIACQTGDQET